MATNQEMLSATYLNAHETRYTLIPAIPIDVWDRSYITRDGKRTSVKQELADCKTLALENRELLNKIIAKLNEGA